MSSAPERKKVGLVSLGCPKALVDSERILTELRTSGYDIVGGYDEAAPGPGEQASLGLARAEFVRRLLSAQGIAPERVAVTSAPLAAEARATVRIFLEPGPAGR